MEKNILKNGTRVISYAPDEECTNELGTITDSYDGTIYPASGKIARVANTFSNFCNGIAKVFYGDIENLPEPKRGTMYIVSAMVLSAEKGKHINLRRKDLVAPATGHPECKRENGFIVSVPGFVR